jgi:hypothetical protein
MNKKSIQKIKNPNGPYKLNLKYKGFDFNVIIDNETFQDFVIKISSKQKGHFDVLPSLKEYLRQEGFLDQALQHNLYW